MRYIIVTARKLILILILIVCFAIPANSQGPEIFLRENFNELENWDELHFPKIKKHTAYSIENIGEESYLKIVSNASASGIVFKVQFSVFEYPKIRWRWKISNVFKKGNAKTRSGDDYPLRIYVIFRYDPESASFGKKLKYGLVRSVYNKYPPDSTLNYIWANRKHEEDIINNPYASESKMIVMQAGSENAGKWIEQEIDIIEDYHRAFGEDPPEIASIAIMGDSDNTGENATAYIDYIEVFR